MTQCDAISESNQFSPFNILQMKIAAFFFFRNAAGSVMSGITLVAGGCSTGQIAFFFCPSRVPLNILLFVFY